MASTNSKYIYGSAAEKLKNEAYDPYEENVVLKSKKIARNNAKIKTKIMLSIFLIFGMCAVIMFRYAQISQLNYDTNKLSKQYTELQNENKRLSIEIEKAMDLNGIREIAETKLKMHKPDKSQIVYINVPKEDMIILANKKESQFMIFVKDVENGIKKFLNVFY